MDLDRSEHRAVINRMKFNKSKCRILYLGWSNVGYKHKLGEVARECNALRYSWMLSDQLGRFFLVLVTPPQVHEKTTQPNSPFFHPEMIFNVLQLWEYKGTSRKQVFLMKRQLSSQTIPPHKPLHQPTGMSPPNKSRSPMARQAGLDYFKEWVYTYHEVILFILTVNNFAFSDQVSQALSPSLIFHSNPQDRRKEYLSAWAKKLKVITLLTNKSQ